MLSQYTVSLLALSSLVLAVPLDNSLQPTIEKRQSTQWIDTCGDTTPGDFKAFNLGGCQAQINFVRGQNVAVQWEFDAVYADGSQRTITPYRDTNSIAVTDTFYQIGYGNNWLTNSASTKAHTAVHEFSDVCRSGSSGNTPVAWYIRATSKSSSCRPNGYRWISPRVEARSGTRPAATSFSARQINSQADLEVSWTAVSGAAAYAVLLRVPTGEYEDYSGYFVLYRGVRVNAPNTRTTISGTASRRLAQEPRLLVVNVVNSQGVWSYTPTTRPVQVRVT